MLVKEVVSMKEKILFTLAVTFLIFSCAGSQPHGADTEKDKGHAPTIVDSYAPSVIRPGKTWRIYLRARDDDGDMKDIVTIFSKEGRTPFKTTVTRIEDTDSKELAGHLFLRIPQNSDLLYRYFTFTVMVRDRKGNKSEPVDFPLRFNYVQDPEVAEKWQEAANRKLGAILIDLDGLMRSKHQKE
jgi:hypothetical protein